MAAQERDAPPDLTALVGSAPWAWDFFQALRHIECARPELPRIGTSRHPEEDPVRFCQEPSLAFPPSALSRLVERGNGLPPQLVLHVFGLLGCNGPMPTCFTEYVHDQKNHHGDATLAAFLDLFHHRLVSLFYRAWACCQQSVSSDRGDDPFAGYIASLLGFGMSSLRQRDAVPDPARLHYAGRLAARAPSADGMRCILTDVFRVPIAVEQFVGQWLAVPAADRVRLGGRSENGHLGQGVVVGQEIWDCQHKFRLRVGPMSFPKFSDLLPGAEGWRRLLGWIRFYAGLELAWDMQLVLTAAEVPRTALGGGSRLGYTSWLRTVPFECDADDLVLLPD